MVMGTAIFSDRHFGRHVRWLRKARGLTQEGLAERCGLSCDTIRRAEHGSFSPSLETLRKLVNGLNMLLSTLFLGLELNERSVRREFLDLLEGRSDEEVALVFRMAWALLEELDDLKRAAAEEPEEGS
jgi:transcriptional regulator with XRE-family HTH domain